MVSNLLTPRQRLVLSYQRKLAKNLALQVEIEKVLNKFPEARLEAIIQRARENPLGTFLMNPEKLKLAARLEKRLIKLKGQSRNYEAITAILEARVQQKPAQKIVATTLEAIPDQKEETLVQRPSVMKMPRPKNFSGSVLKMPRPKNFSGSVLHMPRKMFGNSGKKV